MRQTLKKHERLHGQSTIDRLFLQGGSLFSFPFVVYYKTIIVSEKLPVCSVLFTVSKKKFRQATQRNLLKRRMRAAFRKNKTLIYERINPSKADLHLAFVYINGEIMDYASIEKKMCETFERILLQIAL